MTRKQIHAMFEVGTVWDVVNAHIPEMSGRRVVVERLTEQVVFKSDAADRGWMTLPKAAEVIEAADGYLKYRLFTRKQEAAAKQSHERATVTLTRVAADQETK